MLLPKQGETEPSFVNRLDLLVWYECGDNFYTCESCTEELCSVFCYEAEGTHGYCNYYGELICDEGTVRC